MGRKEQSVSELLRSIAKHKGKKISVGDLVDDLQDAGFAIVLFIFALPMALPLPATGLGLILGAPIMLASLQLILGRHVLWLPKWLRKKHISLKLLRKAIKKTLPMLEEFEHLIHPRLHWLGSRFGGRLVGIVCAVCAVSVLLPFPFTNTVPSMGVCVMAIGLLERDGIATIGGMILGLLGCVLAATAYYVGIDVLTDFLNNLM